jgi:uncharacterized membrane protein YbhN (UPF0104 family)
VKNTLRVGGSLALVVVLALRTDLGVVARAASGVRWGWWLAAVACFVLAQVVSSMRWRALARPLGFAQPLSSFTSWYFVGTFFNLVLPTSVGGDVVRAWYLGRNSSRGPDAVLSVFADRLNGLYVLVALAALAALVVPLPGWVVAWVAGAVACGVTGLVLLLLLPRRAGRDGGPRRGVVGKLRPLAASLVVYRRAPGLLAGVTLYSVCVQSLNVLLVWMLARGVGVSVSLTYCFVFVPLVSLLTLAPFSINGMGVREGGTVLLLAPAGVAAGQAVTLSLLWFSVFLATGMLGGVWYLAGRLPRCEVRTDAEPVGGDSGQGRARQPAAAA